MVGKIWNVIKVGGNKMRRVIMPRFNLGDIDVWVMKLMMVQGDDIYR